MHHALPRKSATASTAEALSRNQARGRAGGTLSSRLKCLRGRALLRLLRFSGMNRSPEPLRVARKLLMELWKQGTNSPRGCDLFTLHEGTTHKYTPPTTNSKAKSPSTDTCGVFWQQATLPANEYVAQIRVVHPHRQGNRHRGWRVRRRGRRHR